ncbi:hypothetical protein FISHEDRAFT_21861, partial [Fistulina hepatica ATCC 64428]
ISDELRARLQRDWKDARYLIVDEFSMLSKKFLARLARHIAIGKAREALFYPTHTSDSQDMVTGRELYESFHTVVILRQQMRVTDEIWRDFLEHLRRGMVQQRHLDMLRTLVITRPECIPTDFSKPPWTEMSLITPRHGVRRHWNHAALRKHCRENKKKLYVCPARDTIRGQELTLRERYALALRKGWSSKNVNGDLPDEVELALGAKVIVTQNLNVDLDIANGLRGTVTGIILDPDEP